MKGGIMWRGRKLSRGIM